MKRNKFSLSNQKLLTCNMGQLVPIGCHEVLPGDTFDHSTSMLIRCSPLLAPPMHPVHARIHHFFVPFRLLWEDWEDFITGGADGEDASVVPTITVNTGSGFATGSLADYLGIPPGVDDITVSALPFRAYAMIWNNFFRDQDLQTELTVSTASGTDSTTNQTIQNICWEKDYYTLSRPTPQKGPAVTIPLGSDAPVKGNGLTLGLWNGTGYGLATNASGVLGGSTTNYDTAVNTASGVNNITSSKSFGITTDGDKSGMIADLSNATAATIDQLRLAFQTQKFQENRMRYGSRYVEYLLGSFNVKSSDARLQLPEYLAGGKQTITFSEVLQTAPDAASGTTGATGVGDIKGHGIAAMRSNRYRRFFEENGLVISLLSVKPKTMYVSGIPRMYSKTTKFDYAQPEFYHTGQQEVYNRELNAAHTTPDGIFGYIDRYDEYRRQESSIAGQFRSTLDEWHFARQFAAGANPTLNGDFVKCVPTEEPFAVPSEDVLWIMASHNLRARRKLPRVGTPAGV